MASLLLVAPWHWSGTGRSPILAIHARYMLSRPLRIFCVLELSLGRSYYELLSVILIENNVLINKAKITYIIRQTTELY